MNTPPSKPGFSGTIRLFRFAGIDVFLHWSWLLVAAYEIELRKKIYASLSWNVAEYLTIFVIVLLHEFGHALACRSVGGRADRILLWPLGGVAYVDPPRRPGAVLWSIAAGPLVNVALVPITIGAVIVLPNLWPSMPDDVSQYLSSVATINILLLAFNLLPIYPLDGGQILQSILWFFLGLPKSLTVAATIGLIGAAAVIVLAAINRNPLLIVLAIFGASRSLGGLKSARALAAIYDGPRSPNARCPRCGEPPPAGDYWQCNCGGAFDTFAYSNQCPHCGGVHVVTACPLCHEVSPTVAWQATPAPMRVEWAKIVDG